MLQALADGETNPATLAALADQRLRATAHELCDAFSACTTLNPCIAGSCSWRWKNCD
jgi:hypothetical protein